MKIVTALNFLLLTTSVSSLSKSSRRNLKGKKAKKMKKSKKLSGLCVVGCTPYVNPDDETAGILKWKALVEEMAESCDIMVHVGDTKAGAAPCNEEIMVSLLSLLISLSV